MRWERLRGEEVKDNQGKREVQQWGRGPYRDKSKRKKEIDLGIIERNWWETGAELHHWKAKVQGVTKRILQGDLGSQVGSRRIGRCSSDGLVAYTWPIRH